MAAPIEQLRRDKSINDSTQKIVFDDLYLDLYVVGPENIAGSYPSRESGT